MQEKNKKYHRLKNLSLPEFLELCSKGELLIDEYKTDIWNYLHKATNHFKLGLVKEIENNIVLREYSIVKKLLNTPKLLKKVIEHRRKENKEIPYCEYSKLAEKLELPRPKKNSIDLEKLAQLIYFKEKEMLACFWTNVGMMNLFGVRKILLDSSEMTNNYHNGKSQGNKENGAGVSSSIKSQPITPKSEILIASLNQYGFKKFLTEKSFTENQIEKIKVLVLDNKLPYQICLLSELGYISYCTKEYCCSKTTERDKLLGKIFQSNARRVKGNINVLVNQTKENKKTYTSHIHKTKIKEQIKGL